MADRKTIDLKHAAKLYESGMPVKEIAIEVGASDRGYLVNRLRAMGYKDASLLPGGIRIDRGKIKALAKAGWNDEEIAHDMYIDVSHVREVLGHE